jgi:hypothetical protein
MEKLKDWITSSYTSVNDKGATKYFARNCVALAITSNHPDCLPPQGDTDRRWLATQSNAKTISRFNPELDRDTHKLFAAATPGSDTHAEIVGWVKEFSYANINPAIMPMNTQTIANMRETSMGALASAIHEIKADVAAGLRPDIMTREDLLAELAVAMGTQHVSWSSNVKSELRKAGASFGPYVAKKQRQGTRVVPGPAKKFMLVSFGEEISTRIESGAGLVEAALQATLPTLQAVP